MSRRKKRKVEVEDKAEIDLTPMLDVVFIMLIFFIVTASFVKEKSLAINVPPQDEPTEQQTESTNILIQITSSDEIYMDGQRIDVRAVRSRVAQKHAENPEGAVIVRAHENATTETYIEIKDAAREAKVYNVSLVPFAD